MCQLLFRKIYLISLLFNVEGRKSTKQTSTVNYTKASVNYTKSNDNNKNTGIQLAELDPVIDFNNLKEQDFYFKEAMKKKHRLIYYSSNIIFYLSLIGVVKWDQVIKFTEASDGFFLLFTLIHLLMTSSIFFTYYNTYRNVILYGRTGITLAMCFTVFFNNTSVRSPTFFYISTVCCSVAGGILLAIYNRKVYSINIQEIIEELQEEKKPVNKNMVLLI